MAAWRTWAGRIGAIAGTVALLAGGPAARADDAPVVAQVSDPRAFGHQVGDVVQRRVVLDVPRRLTLAEGSLPALGRVGQSFELRRVGHTSQPTLGGRRHVLELDYQVFRAPVEPRVLDLPSFTLRFEGQPRGEELRIDFAPLVIAPLTPPEPVLRAGLGLLQPDVPPPPVDTAPQQRRLAAYALLALLPLAHLAAVYLGAPWWRRRQRPFARAARTVRGVPLEAPADAWLGAWRALHAALDATADQVQRLGSVDDFVAARPRYAALHADLQGFFERSERFFFGGQQPAAADRTWLREFARRCVDVERGAA